MATDQPQPAPTTPPAAATSAPPLSPLDREKLAYYLGSRLEPHYLTRDDIDPAALESWAKSPTIAPHIHGFRYINSLASSNINQANYIDAQTAVGEELRAATTSTDRLRAISAFIRLSNSYAATLRARKSRAKPVATASPRPIATTAARRREIERQQLDSLGLLPLPGLPRVGAPQPAAPVTARTTAAPTRNSTPNPGTPAPGSVHPTTTVNIPAPNRSTPLQVPAPHSPTTNGTHKPATPNSQAQTTNRNTAPEPSRLSPHSSERNGRVPEAGGSPRRTETHTTSARDLLAKAGAAPCSAWP